MGAYDYEKSKRVIIGGSSFDDRMKINLDYVSEYSFAVTCEVDYSARYINRPVFYYTRMREDIIFIHSILFGIDTSINYILAVNEKSFWRRFTIIYESKKLSEYDGLSVKNIIQECMKFPNKYKIKLNLYKFESEKLPDCTGDYNAPGQFNNLSKCLYDGAPVRFCNYEARNKRMWLHIFNNPAISYPKKCALGEPGLSAGEGSMIDFEGHFDITSEDKRKYEVFIS